MKLNEDLYNWIECGLKLNRNPYEVLKNAFEIDISVTPADLIMVMDRLNMEVPKSYRINFDFTSILLSEGFSVMKDLKTKEIIKVTDIDMLRNNRYYQTLTSGKHYYAEIENMLELKEVIDNLKNIESPLNTEVIIKDLFSGHTVTRFIKPNIIFAINYIHVFIDEIDKEIVDKTIPKIKDSLKKYCEYYDNSYEHLMLFMSILSYDINILLDENNKFIIKEILEVASNSKKYNIKTREKTLSTIKRKANDNNNEWANINGSIEKFIENLEKFSNSPLYAEEKKTIDKITENWKSSIANSLL